MKKKIKKRVPKNCGKCDYSSVDRLLGICCAITSKPILLEELDGPRPEFCPYEVAKKELRNCSNCSVIEKFEEGNHNIYAWCPLNKWAFERGLANSEHSCCTDWRDDNAK